jgi:hypothetical protein
VKLVCRCIRSTYIRKKEGETIANFANTEAGRIVAETWARAKVADKTWVEAHMTVNKDGNVVVRFIRPMAPTSATTKGYGAWTESRADDAT